MNKRQMKDKIQKQIKLKAQIKTKLEIKEIKLSIPIAIK